MEAVHLPGSAHSSPLMVKYQRMQQFSQPVIRILPNQEILSQVSVRTLLYRHVYRGEVCVFGEQMSQAYVATVADVLVARILATWLLL